MQRDDTVTRYIVDHEPGSVAVALYNTLVGNRLASLWPNVRLGLWYKSQCHFNLRHSVAAID